MEPFRVVTDTFAATFHNFPDTPKVEPQLKANQAQHNMNIPE